VKVAATDSDPGEQILYQVFVPTGMTLTALNGAALGSATAATGGLTYTVAAKTAGGADNLGNYALISDANRSGTFTVKLTPLAQEVDGTQKAGTQASADLVVKPVIDGADGLRMQNVEISEDQYSLSAAGAPTLASLVKVAASDSDPGEQIFYRVFVSTGVTLIALNGIDLGSAVAADGGKAYLVAAKTADGGDNLGNYALLPDANQWGSYTVSMTPLAREVDGSERASGRISAQLVVDPVADTATLTNNTQLLQLGITKPLVDDGSTSGPAGSNVLHLPISISGVSDLDTKEAVTLVLTGDIFSQPGVTLQLRLTDGSTRAYTPYDGTIRIEEFDVAGNLPALSGEVLIPKGQAYGAHTLSAAVETQDGSAISPPQLAATCDFAVISATPPAPSVGVAIDATTDVSGDISLGDILRVPNAVANQRLEVTFPVDASAAFYLLTAAGDIVEPSLGSNVYSLPVMEIGNYRIHWNAKAIDHSIVFRARVAVPDFGGDSYSRFVDYALTAGPDADGSYASDNWLITAGNATLDAGDGNDVVQLTGLANTAVLHGGAGHDALIMTGLANAVTVDLNLGWVTTNSGVIAQVDGFESFVGTSQDDSFFGSSVDGAGITVRGGGGDDWLVGSVGNDVLEGGSGNDYLEGGDGVDRFVLMPGGGNDVIGDFDPLHDRIVMAGLGFARGQSPSDVLSIQLIDHHWHIAATQSGVVASFTLDEASVATTAQQISDERAAIAAAIDLVEGVDIWSVDPLPSVYPLGFDPSHPDAIAGHGDDNSNVLTADDRHTVLFGAGGADTLIGDAKANVLVGGSGMDKLTGGGGNDLFVFIKALENPADQKVMGIVEDFNRQDGDRIVVAGFSAAPEIMAVEVTQDQSGAVVSATQTVHLDNYSIIFNLTQQRSSEHEFQLRQADFDRL